MEDPFTTITINIPETPAGDRVRRIKGFVENSPGIIIRPVKLASVLNNWKGGIVIQPYDRKSWIAMIEPWKDQVIIKGSSKIPFNDKSEEAILMAIIKYYHDELE